MRAPLSWLEDWVEITETPEKIAELLLLSGTKVETIEYVDREAVLVLEITSNRPDCLSLFGIAREIAALTNKVLKHREFPLPKRGSVRKELKITVVDPKLCPVYTSIVIDNVMVKPSPDWMAKRLASVGVRPINNIVDVSNYVMFEYGIPMHTFNYDQLLGQEITIRGSSEGEKVTPLDGQERVLHEGSIIIEDTKRLVDLAGIMGGQNSEISESTKTVFLHLPIYDPIAIRRTAKYFGLRTEAVTRYEKKLDLRGTQYAMQRAVSLITQVAGGEVASDVYSLNTVHFQPPTVTLTESAIERHIGISIPTTKVQNLLKPLGFNLEFTKPLGFSITPPSFRRDIAIKEDVIEEIARMYGYNNLPLTLPKGDIPTHPDAFTKDWIREMKSILVALGFTEVYGSTLIGRDDVESIGLSKDETLAVLHPMSRDYEYMRPTLLPGLLEMVRNNLYHTEASDLFEIGTVFYPQKEDLPREEQQLVALSTRSDYRDFKSKLERLLRELGLEIAVQVAHPPPPYFVPTAVGKTGKIGWIGMINSKVAAAFGIERSLWAFELNASEISQQARSDRPYPQLPKFPPIIEDLSFEFPTSTYIGEVIAAMKSQDPTVQTVQLIDHFASSYTFRIYFIHPEKTLTSDEVAIVRQAIVAVVEERFKAKIKR